MELFFPGACDRVARYAWRRAPGLPAWQVKVYTDVALVALLTGAVLEAGMAAIEAIAVAAGREPPWPHAVAFWTAFMLTSMVAAQVRGLPDDFDGGPRQMAGA